MKKLIIVLVFLISVMGFSEKKDGTYYVEKDYNNNWKSFVRIIVKDNNIIGIQYDRKNQLGELFSINQKENEKYKEKYGTSFRDITFYITREIVDTQNVDSISNIKDENLLNEVKQMLNFLIEKANIGENGVFKL